MCSLSSQRRPPEGPEDLTLTLPRPVLVPLTSRLGFQMRSDDQSLNAEVLGDDHWNKLDSVQVPGSPTRLLTQPLESVRSGSPATRSGKHLIHKAEKPIRSERARLIATSFTVYSPVTIP